MSTHTEHMTPEEFAHHTASVCGALGWIPDGNAIVGPNGKRMEWPGDIAVGCASNLIPVAQRRIYSNRLPLNKPFDRWTYVDRLRAFSAAVGRPWGGAQ